MSKQRLDQDFHFTTVGAFMAAVQSAAKSDRMVEHERKARISWRVWARSANRARNILRPILLPGLIVIMLALVLWW